MQSECKYIYYH
jgi:uncharacterized protein YajQ (UPF0234 family)